MYSRQEGSFPVAVDWRRTTTCTFKRRKSPPRSQSLRWCLGSNTFRYAKDPIQGNFWSRVSSLADPRFTEYSLASKQ